MTFPNDPPYVIAEVGGNHAGDADVAKEYLRTAAETGVDAVKFQYYRAETLIASDTGAYPGAPERYDTQFERFRELELTRAEWDELVSLADDLGVDFAASVFDRETATYVSEVSPFVKIASGDVTNVPLLRHVSTLDVPVVMSTGFATFAEIDRAVDELRSTDLTLLHCIGSYPTEPDQANLQLIDALADRYDLPVGYSDHTVGLNAARAAIARGAIVVEKHFTLESSAEGGDHGLSADPDEMAQLVRDVEEVWMSYGSADREDSFAFEVDLRESARRSLATVRDVEVGETFTRESLGALRPERGISPLRIDEVLGKRATRDCEKHTILTDSDVEGL